MIPQVRPAVGVLMLDAAHLEEPGSVGSPSSFAAPASYTTVAGATGDAILSTAFQGLKSAYVLAASELAATGHSLLTSNCGFTIPFQDAVRDETDTPTALSSLLLVPLLVRVYGSRLGVLAFRDSALDRGRRTAAGWPDVDIPVEDVQHSEVWRTLNGPRGSQLPVRRLRDDLLETAQLFAETHELHAILLECTGFSAFRSEIEAATGARTFDIVDLINFLLPNGGR